MMMKRFWLPFAVCLAPVFAAAPADMKGKMLTADYTQAEFRSIVEDKGETPWVPFAKLPKNGTGAAEAFMDAMQPKATRNIIPITRPGAGGVYTYRKTGENTAVISVDMWKAYQYDMCRTYKLTFLSDTEATAEEEIGHGSYTGLVRGIRMTVRPAGHRTLKSKNP